MYLKWDLLYYCCPRGFSPTSLMLGLAVETVHAVGLLKREVSNEIPCFRRLKFPLFLASPPLLFLPFTLPYPWCLLCLCPIPRPLLWPECGTVARSPSESMGRGHAQYLSFSFKIFLVIMVTLDLQELIPGLPYIIWIANITLIRLQILFKWKVLLIMKYKRR